MQYIFQLKDLEFPVAKAEFTGCLYDDVTGPPFWNLDVRGEGRMFGDEDIHQILSPRFYWYGFPIQIDDWRALEGFHCRFDEDVDVDAPAFDDGPNLYLCSHMPLPRFEIAVLARDRDQFTLRWSGQADANWDREYGDGMPFRMEFPVAFVRQEVRFVWETSEAVIQDNAIEAAARAVMKRHGLHDDALCFSGWQRFRDEPANEYYRLIRAFFVPTVRTTL